MAGIVGALLQEAQNNAVNYNYDAIGKNSEVFTLGDPVKLVSGQLAVAGTTDAVLGICAKTVTMAANNAATSGPRVVVPYLPLDETTIMLMGTNSDLTGNATDPGTYFKLSANTTNTVVVDTTNGVQTTTSRVVMIKEVDPFSEGGTGAGSGLRKVLVVVGKRTPDIAGV